MGDYPSSSPWGPHGPQVSEPSVTPNPTAPYQEPSFGGGGGGDNPSPGYGGGGGGGYVGGGGGVGIRWSLWQSMGILGAAGGILGALYALGRGSMVHLPAGVLGPVTLRYGIAGAAFGASVPPVIKMLASVLKAAIWWVLAMILWWIGLSLLGASGWMTRWIH